MFWTILSEFFEKGLAPLKVRWNTYRTGTDFADQNEMLFENREKRYGAYQLRKNYPWHLLTGVSVVSSAFLFGVMIPVWLAPPPPPADPVPLARVVKVELSEIDLPDRIEIRSAHLMSCFSGKPFPHKQPMDLSLWVAEEALEEGPMFVEELELVQWDEPDLVDELELELEEEIPIVEEWEPDAEDFLIGVNEPKPLNIREIAMKIGYPQIARDAGFMGTVVLRVKVGKDGTYQKHQVLRAAHPLLTEAVENEIAQLRFTPAYQAEKAIPFWVNVPFSFHPIN